ncbi:hypothetical protein OAR97_05875 [Arcobacteraceae bacterium]|nr:hypothetical protein [Arcobacteraceae bacterium]
MGLLLYKSDEMYSSTELIRKSKMIFDKVLDKKIDKAIILRDGKPCFLLMEFKKYEKIMAEYEELKSYVDTLQNTPSSKKVKKEKIEKSQKIQKEPIKINSIQNITPEDKTKIEKLSKKDPEISEEQEINNALRKIENIDFDDTMKKEAEKKIKLRILEARKQREKILSNEQQNKEDLKEELILQSQLKEVKLQKDRELREFWD